jgi:hypothetical protein
VTSRRAQKSSAGGKADATGGNYETLVAAWYCTRLLLGRSAHPPFDLPASARLGRLACQTDEPIDDLNCDTTDQGRIFIQAKRSVSLSKQGDSPLGKTIDQFVRQKKAWADAAAASPMARTLDPRRDRLILATRNGSSRKIVEILPRLLRGLRDQGDPQLLTDVQTSQEEQEVASAIETQIRRSWLASYSRDATSAEIGSLLRLVWIHPLDVEEGERDRSGALDLMRAAVLADPVQADLAFSELVKLCARLRAERSATDVSTLQLGLARVGVKLVALPDYRSDIEALRNWTNVQLQKAPRFTRLLETMPDSVIEREVWPICRDGAPAESFLVVGDPGAGKSGLIYRLASHLRGVGADVVFIPVELLNITALSDLQGELGISRALGEVLQNWPGTQRAALIVDALDAARKFETQTVLRETIDQVFQLAGGRWNVVASVRKYDLREGTEWRRLFHGPPLSNVFLDHEFTFVRHLWAGRLSEEEILQTTVFSPELNRLFLQANPKLKLLLRNIFNLHLLAELIVQGVVEADLISIRTQSELLDTYWRHRVRRHDGNHDAREIALTAVTQEMIARKSLRIFRADIRDRVETAALIDLERNDILRAEDDIRGANEDILLFSHNVLFDYAIARLLFRRGKDPARLTELLRADRSLALMVGPSLTMALHDVWTSDSARAAFWALALALAREDGLPQAAYLAAPMVAAESAVTLADVEPLLSKLRQSDTSQKAAERIVQHLIGALLVRQKGGASFVGPAAGPWMEFAEALSALRTDAAMFAIKPLVALGTEAPEKLVPEQTVPTGMAARRLLEYGLSRQPRASHLIIAAIIAVAKTMGTDPEASSHILHRLIEPSHLAEFGYEELRWLASNIGALAKHDLPLVVDIYQAAYGYEDSRHDAKTNIGNSGILPLTSNRRQDYQSAWYQLEQAAIPLLEESAVEGTRAVAHAILGYVQRERRSYIEGTPIPEAFTLGGRTAHYLADDSHIWYRGGFREPNDGPALLAKWDAFLSDLASSPNAAVQLQRILHTLADEAGLAVLWGAMLVIGSQHASEFAAVLAPLAAASPVLAGDDTRYQAGQFITVAYPYLSADQRRDIETAILSITHDRTKEALASCVPESLVITVPMAELLTALRSRPKPTVNTPPYLITSESRAFDTDAYLRELGVKTSEPANSKLRDAMKPVEALPQAVQGPEITREIAETRLGPIDHLLAELKQTPKDSVDSKLYEHATGALADAASRTALAPQEVIRDPDVRRHLLAALAFAANSENPHFDPRVEEKFHDDLAWGGPSARTSAARGLICLVRTDMAQDADAMAIIHELARDPVCHVRLQIIENLHVLHKLEPDWMWGEYERVVQYEPTRGVVDAALQSAARIAFLDESRFVALAKCALTRYAEEAGPGIDSCRTTASSLIADIYVSTDNAEAQDFVLEQIRNFPTNAGLLKLWVSRFSSLLLVGSTTDPTDRENVTRAKTLGLYQAVLNASHAEADRIGKTHDIQKFGTWPKAQQDALREMFDVMDAVVMRLFFAAGGDNEEIKHSVTDLRIRLYAEIRPFLEKLSDVIVVHVAHYLVQTLESFVAIDAAGVFELIARSVRASEKGGYTLESMGADLVVRIVERYLAEHREVFAGQARLNDLMDCLDAFVRAGWPAAQALTFRLGEIWR